jgi:16S rRNA (cytosine967-C5)-methyltransferase
LSQSEAAAATDPRLAAFHILADVRAGEYADRAASRRLSNLDTRDRALAQELAYGAVRLRGRLDAELAALLDRPLDRIEPAVLDCLRLGLYQLRETRIPDHASVDAAVRCVQRFGGRGAAGLANAVLRRAARDGVPAAAFPDPERDSAGHLATWGSHPRWLVDRWLERWPLASVRRLIENDNRAPRVTLRVLEGADLSGVESGAQSGIGLGMKLEAVPGWRAMYWLEEGRPEQAIRELRAVIQDPAASAVVDYVGERVAGPVVDLCAAPGGKAIGLAAAAPAARPFVAADVSQRRLGRLRATVARVALDVHAVCMDGRSPAVAKANTVLLDAPCTGTGVLRRRPDARWRITPEGLASLVVLQRDLLDGAAGIVAPGGLLVYSTCSLEPEENERQVSGFLARHPDFEREEPGPGRIREGLVDERGDLRVEPWSTDTDGAFASRLRRKTG